MAITDEDRTFNEKTTGEYSFTMLNEAGAAIALASIVTAKLTLKDVSTGDTINSRSEQSIVNLNNVTIHATSGLVTWSIQQDDNKIVTAAARGKLERHEATFDIVFSTNKRLTFTEIILVRSMNVVS